MQHHQRQKRTAINAYFISKQYSGVSRVGLGGGFQKSQIQGAGEGRCVIRVDLNKSWPGGVPGN